MTPIEQIEIVDGAEGSVSQKSAWSRPAFRQFDLSQSETANTNSNFDGTNYSS